MLKPSLDKFLDIEPVLSCDYAVAFPNIPQLGYYAASVELPGITVETVHYELYGKTREAPGRRIESHELPITFILDRKAVAFKSLIGIMNSTSDPKTGVWTAAPFTILVEQHDSAGELVSARRFTGCWGKELGSYTLESSGGESFTIVNMNFYYDKQQFLWGPNAPADIALPINGFLDSIGGNPRELLSQFEQLLKTGPAGIAGIISTAQNAVAFGRSVINQVTGTVSELKSLSSTFKSNPVQSLSSAVSLAKRNVSTVRKFF